jgi:hypothetical protein
MGLVFVIWSRGPDKLNKFLEYLNGRQDIYFTMQSEENSHLPFLEINVYRSAGSLQPVFQQSVAPATGEQLHNAHQISIKN